MWCHHVLKRERGRGVEPPWGEGGEGWCHCEEEEGEGRSHRVEAEGEGESGGATVWRRREEGRGVVPP